MPQDMNYKAGTLLLITSGEYSDYSHRGLFRAVKDFNIKAAIAVWIEREAPNLSGYHFDEDSLVAWLSRESYIEDVEHTELWLGAYSSFPQELRP